MPNSSPEHEPAATAETGAGASSAQFTSVRTVEEARELLSEYDGALAAKAAELATLRELFEKTRQHLIRLQLSVTELRAERHRLADLAMKAEVWQRQVEILTRERDELPSQLDARQHWRD